MPLPVSEEFLAVQDAYLREETARKGITHWKDTERADGDIYLWRGGYHHSGMRRDCQRGEFADARLFYTLPWLY